MRAKRGWWIGGAAALLAAGMLGVGGGEEGAGMPAILSMKRRAELQDRWLMRRLETVAPMLMAREGIDTWVIIAREYNEDPVIETMLPAKWQSARRRTVLVFARGGKERFAVSRYDVGAFFKSRWNKEKQPDQWAALAGIVAESDPETIAVNASPTFALADGLSHSQYEAFKEALPKKYAERLVTGERLAIGWLEARIPEEMEVYPAICRIAHRIIAEGLSDKVIQPGATTTDDVAWWYRERIRGLKLQAWFHPSVEVQRATAAEDGRDPKLIRPGDLIWVDFGITYLGLNTDTQQHAYVLKSGERDAPIGLKRALKVGNRLQDILTGQFREGRSGNQVLKETRRIAIEEGITPSIYTHPIGYHGHGAGPTIGLWDQQGGVPGRGDYPLFPNTAYSIELNASVPLPEWGGQTIKVMLEEDGFFTGEGFYYIDGRQTELHLIRGAP